MSKDEMSELMDLLEGMLRLDPRERVTAKAALDHPYLKNVPKVTGKGEKRDLTFLPPEPISQGHLMCEPDPSPLLSEPILEVESPPMTSELPPSIQELQEKFEQSDIN